MADETSEDETAPLVLGNIAIHPVGHRLTVDGHSVSLTAREFNLAVLLGRHAGQVLSYNTITLAIFGPAGAGDTRHLSVLIHRLRAKLGRTRPYAIETVRGRGYGLLEVPGLNSTALSGRTPAADDVVNTLRS